MWMVPLLASLAVDAVLVDELEPLFPDRAPEASVASIEAPRGAIVGVHVFITGCAAGAPLRASIRGEASLPSPTWYRLVDVPVEENTGPESRTERWDKAENPHVIRDAPFRVYEVLSPIDGTVAAPRDPEALRVEWALPMDTVPGVRAMEIVLEHGDDVSVHPIAVTVRPAVVPPPGRDTLGYTNWFSPSNIASYHGVELWSEPFWTILERYAACMHRGRQNMFWVRWPDFFDVRDGRPVLDEARLARYVNAFSEAGLHWIEGAPPAGRPGGDWSSPVLELKIGGALLTSAAGRAAFEDQASQLWAAIERRGWSDRWVQHIADEPTDVNAEDYALAATMFRQHLPGVPIFEATMSRELVDAVDWWCPQVQAWQGNQSFFDQRQRAGDRVWVYTCLRPGGPWLNRLLDQERLRSVYFGWGAARHGWDGYLHWGLNHWKADPFTQSVVDHPAMPGTDNRLPAGDTHVLFPGEGGPYSGVRFEAHRIGAEDHELLGQLSSDVRAGLIERVYRAADDFETRVEAYRATRGALLDAVEAAPPSVRIELLGFPECPLAPTLTRLVREASTTVAPAAVIITTDLTSLSLRDPRLRWPAPTVLVDGVDLFGLPPRPEPAISCRVYPGGLPGAAEVTAALAEVMSGQQ
ncbi:MAG: DUF4091 domain-containing protein [Phycisphaerales bacterium]|nr:DUF4091 domain-containing protein [Phycisphaerales bacterium]